jgi:16S rRNA (cytosine967-C5)-methyltransferase
MQKGIKTRFIAHEILFQLREKNINYDEILNFNLSKHSLSFSDKKLIHTIVLTSMRHHIYVKKIISQYVLKKCNIQQYILFLSAITQIVYLNFKDYAVVNSTVELAKNRKINIYPGFVNAVLKKIAKNRIELKKTNIKFSDLPSWFTNNSKNFSNNAKNNFLQSILEKPNINLVFKNQILKKLFKFKSIDTSDKSLIIENPIQIEKLPRYSNGDWWVQDYASMLPLHLIGDLFNKAVIDMCSAPGGKSFQAISLGAKLDLIEVSLKRAKILKENLNRLKFNHKIKIEDALKISNRKKYDYILIDTPCSSVGTIRRNPEIFFRKSIPNLKSISIIQKKLLDKASKIVKKKGIIVYMACSFLPVETTQQINNFLEKNKNFEKDKFVMKSNKDGIIDNSGYINIIPKTLKNYNIDGFFAAKMIRND